MAKEMETIQARRDRLDQTVWAKELLAQQHEAVFVQLWDDLRTQEDPFEILSQFPFGELLLGTAGQPVMNDHNITVTHFGDPVRRLTPAAWRQVLEKFEQQGYRLEQSEWRHPRFDVATNGVASSVLAMTLHVANPGLEERWIVRGNLRVAWRKKEQPTEKPVPELLEAGDLEMLSRRGETPFHHVVAADLTPEKFDARFLEPSLQLYDLDVDGLSEIILARRNLVFWNKGQGQFRQGLLCEHPLAALNASLLADFDGDGLADFLCAHPQGLALFKGDWQGRFLHPASRAWLANPELPNPFVMSAGDVDQDGDLDIWLAQYKVPYQGGQFPTPYYEANDGHPSFLLANDGHGHFQDRSVEAGLAQKRFRRTYGSSFVDLDEDGDLDLLVTSDFAGTDVYANDGQGHFTDVTNDLLDERHNFGMSHVFGDFDQDGDLDFLVIGMNSFAADRLNAWQAGRQEFPEHRQMRSKMAYGNRLYLRTNGRFRQTALSSQVARTGWSWGVAAGDFDNDGDADLYVVNGHISGRSVRDYETEFWRHDIYAANSADDPVWDRYFRSVHTRYHGAGQSYGGFEKNRFFMNQSGRSFLETGYLMGVAMEEDCRNVVSDDLDGDGKLDLLVTTFQVWPRTRQELHLFPNFSENTGHWIGLRLRESAPGCSPVGAKVTLVTTAGRQIRFLVTGDSYRSQQAATVHFGLGRETQVQSLEIVWPNGRKKTVRNPAINRYHWAAREGE
ncbi:MAG: CRTAC1 family protein [Chloroflexi bacterium]|nr:CRTAC1 family protein [Chloroflexota bacterium]